jgi:hypothetical protein
VPISAANLQHPAFPQLDDPSVLVWRYMDLAKYISLLTRKALHLTSIEKLDDPFEGSVPHRNRDAWIVTTFLQMQALEGGPPPDALLQLQKDAESQGRLTAKLRKAFYVNCWRWGNDESEAMWKLYCGSDQGVALVLPYRRLVESLSDPSIYIGRVTYLDYDNSVLPLYNKWFPFMHKRISFSHEQEVRIFKPGKWPEMMSDPEMDLPIGIELPWQPEAHVERVVINPYSRRWFHDAIRDVTRALAPILAERVCESRMAAQPTF